MNNIKLSTFIIASIHPINKILNFFNLKNTIIEDIFVEVFNIMYYNPDKNGNGTDVKLQMLQKIKDNKNILIFPEGHYSRSQNKILPFKLGGLKMAYDNKLPIIPIIFYYTNINHIHLKPEMCSISDFIKESLAIYKETGDIIVHQCNDGKDVLPLPNESFENFHKRLYNIMQSTLTKLDKKYNPKNY